MSTPLTDEQLKSLEVASREFSKQLDAVTLDNATELRKAREAFYTLCDPDFMLLLLSSHSEDRKEIERLTDAAGGWWDCLEMVRETLTAFLGDEHMKGCPPMFYNDAIRSVAHRAAFGKLPEEMYPEGSLLHRTKEAQRRIAELEAAATAVCENAVEQPHLGLPSFWTVKSRLLNNLRAALRSSQEPAPDNP